MRQLNVFQPIHAAVHFNPNETMKQIHLFTALSLVATFAILPTQGLAQSVQVRIEAGNAADAQQQSGSDELTKKVNALKASIEKSKEAFKNVNRTKESVISAFDQNLDVIKAALKDVTQGGEIYSLVTETGKKAEDVAKIYKEKATDPKKDVDQQRKYKKLADEFTSQRQLAYQQLDKIEIQRELLQKSLKLVENDKEFFLDELLSKDIAVALKGVDGVLAAMNDVSNGLDQIMKPTATAQKTE